MGKNPFDVVGGFAAGAAKAAVGTAEKLQAKPVKRSAMSSMLRVKPLVMQKRSLVLSPTTQAKPPMKQAKI